MDKNRPSEEQPICGAQSGEQRIRKECGVKTLGSTNPRGSDNTEVCCHQVKPNFPFLLRQITLRSNILYHHFYLPEVDIQVQNGN